MKKRFLNLKKLYFEFKFSPRKFSGQPGRTEKLFQVSPDPWNFEQSRYEKKRFNYIFSLIKSVEPKSILEIGCAEGYLTKRLLGICSNIVAVDISETAIKRARKFAPRPKYIVGDIMKLKKIAYMPYSLAVATEVLYYLRKIDSTRLLKHLKIQYLVTSNSWNVSFNVDEIIKKSGYRMIKKRWIFALEDYNLKGSHIVLWKKQG